MAYRRNSSNPFTRFGRICLAVAAFSVLAIPVARVSAQMVEAADVEATMAQAEETFARATELGHAWSVTRPLLEEARSDLANGELDAAMANARRALLTAEQSVEQAERERDAWRARVPGG